MAKFRIEYDMEGCIGAGSCAAVNSKDWVMNDEGKAVLVDSREENGIWVKDIGESELEINKQAAEVCPVAVIKIKNAETGEEIKLD